MIQRAREAQQMRRMEPRMHPPMRGAPRAVPPPQRPRR
jgi:hypothetical protein